MALFRRSWRAAPNWRCITEPQPDGLGGYTESWAEVAMVFGRIEPVSRRAASVPTRRWRA